MNAKARQYISALIKYGSITQAANRLFITPSALSKYIKSLEEETGCVLFDRIGNQFVLTYAGEKYYEWCKHFDMMEEQMHNEMTDLSKERTGRIRIGIQSPLSDFLICQVLPEFTALYPDVKISITEDISSNIFQKMKQFELDAAITNKEPRLEQFYKESIIKFPYIIAVPSGHPLLKRAKNIPGVPYPWIDLDWCRGERFIMMHSGQNPQKDTERMLAEILDDIKVCLEVRNVRTMLEAVENNHGIILTSAGLRKLFSGQWNNIEYLSFGEKPIYTDFWLYYHKDMYISSSLKAFLDIIKNKSSMLKI